jgi:hypothetical protein
MKKLITILFFFICLKSFGQYPQKAPPTGNDSALQVPKGATQGKFILITFTDTTAANVSNRAAQYPGYIIFTTSDNNVWIRNSTASAWVQVSGSGGSGFTTADNGLTANTSTNVQWGGRLLQNTTISGANLRTLTFDSMRTTRFNLQTGINGNFIINQNSINRLNVSSALTRISGNLAVSDGAYTDYSNGFTYIFGADSVFIGVEHSGATSVFNYIKQKFIDSSISISSKWADQYASDSLIWRRADRTSFYKITNGVGHIYADDSLILESETGTYTFTDLLTGTTSDKVALFDANGHLKQITMSSIIGATPTWEATLTAQSTTAFGANHTVNINSHDLTFNTAKFTVTGVSGYSTLLIDDGDANQSYLKWDDGSFISELVVSAGGSSISSTNIGGILSGSIDVSKDSVIFYQTNAAYRFKNLSSSIDTTTYKPFAITTNGILKRMNSWAQVSGGAGSSTWNGITNPTGDQALTFDAGESSTWTNSNTTEDLFTVNSSTMTTSSLFSLNSTSTALAAGNNLMELVMSGANGTNAITANPLRISVTNTNATSGTNIGLDVTATGATTANVAAQFTAPNGSSSGLAIRVPASSGRVAIGQASANAALDVVGTAILDAIQTSSTGVNSNLFTGTTAGTTATTNSAFLFPGGSNTAFHMASNGNTASTLTAGHDYAGLVGTGGSFTEAGSSSHPRAVGGYFRTPTITNGAGATDTVSALYLEGAAPGITPTYNTVGLIVNRGDVLLNYGNLLIGKGTTASEVRFYEPSASGTNYTSFKAGAMVANIAYTLPTAAASVDGSLLQSTTGSVLSWGSPATIIAAYAWPLGGGGDLTADVNIRTQGSDLDIDNNGADRIRIGDVDNDAGGNVLTMAADGTTNVSNNALTGKFGINTTPTVALDVVGNRILLRDGTNGIYASVDDNPNVVGVFDYNSDVSLFEYNTSSGSLSLNGGNIVVSNTGITTILNLSAGGNVRAGSGTGLLTVSNIAYQVQGADVASTAGAMTLGNDGNVFEITGTNTITLLSNVGFQNGDEVTLMFTSTATLTNGTASSGTNIKMLLAGGANFVATANDLITLVLGEIGGTQVWREKCRSVN